MGRELQIGLFYPHRGKNLIFGKIKEDGEMVLKSPILRNNIVYFEKSWSIHRIPQLKYPGGVKSEKKQFSNILYNKSEGLPS